MTADDRTASAPTTRDRVRAILVLVAVPATLLGAAVGSGLLGGGTAEGVGEGAFASDATPLAPAGTAFSIWSVIYLGLAVYGIWQVLPRNQADPRQRWMGWLALASMVLNAAWITASLATAVALTVVIIVALLLTLIAIFETLRRIRARSLVETVVVDGTFGLYLGWVCVATVANVAAWLADMGLRPEAFAIPASIVLVVVAGIGIALALRGHGRLGPMLAIVWGVAWIGVARATGEPSSTVIPVVAAIVCVVVAAATVAARLRAHRRPQRAVAR
ncbi:MULTISPECIES: TspO/MBR family protein [unclassified Agrococcus]|uniref:TspO/MBR family protein n=1 Tax=unclassified Agrococcus TaxID=2615065 RepID=UPI003608DDBE